MKQQLGAANSSNENLRRLIRSQQQNASDQVRAIEERYAMVKEMNMGLEKRILQLQSDLMKRE
jgi:hypothetical protein